MSENVERLLLSENVEHALITGIASLIPVADANAAQRYDVARSYRTSPQCRRLGVVNAGPVKTVHKRIGVVNSGPA